MCQGQNVSICDLEVFQGKILDYNRLPYLGPPLISRLMPVPINICPSLKGLPGTSTVAF
jgi:hypothetical protein